MLAAAVPGLVAFATSTYSVLGPAAGDANAQWAPQARPPVLRRLARYPPRQI